MPRPKMGQRRLDGRPVANLEAFYLKIRRVGKMKADYGPYYSEDDVLKGVHDSELGVVASWAFVLKLNGGYSKNPEKGATSIVNWRGPLGEVFGMLGPLLKREHVDADFSGVRGGRGSASRSSGETQTSVVGSATGSESAAMPDHAQDKET